jgi:hypothetical protein
MAQFIPTVPGVGGALGTGLSKSLNALAESKIKQMTEAPQRQAYANALLAILGGNPQEGEATPQQDSNVGAAGLIPQQASSQPQIPKNPLVDALKKGGINEQQLFQLAGLQQQKQLRANEQSKQARKEQFEAQREINKSTQKYYDQVIGESEAAKTSNKRLTKMSKLIEKGELPYAATYNLLKNLEDVSETGASKAGLAAAGSKGGVVGAIVGAFISPIVGALKSGQKYFSPGTEEFEKLSADFIRDAKQIFGGRITDADLKAFLQTVPTLAQTDNGKRKIINNIRSANDAAIAKSEALREILEENDGKRPANLQFLVEERARKKIDKAAQEFNA